MAVFENGMRVGRAWEERGLRTEMDCKLWTNSILTAARTAQRKVKSFQFKRDFLDLNQPREQEILDVNMLNTLIDPTGSLIH